MIDFFVNFQASTSAWLREENIGSKELLDKYQQHQEASTKPSNVTKLLFAHFLLSCLCLCYLVNIIVSLKQHAVLYYILYAVFRFVSTIFTQRLVFTSLFPLICALSNVICHLCVALFHVSY